MLIFSKLNALEKLKEKAQIAFEDCTQAGEILEPSGSKSPGFHIYSDYSDLLKEIRAEKRELEREIAKAKAADRPNLMRQRSLLVSRENNEEDRIRQELGTALQAHLPCLKPTPGLARCLISAWQKPNWLSNGTPASPHWWLIISLLTLRKRFTLSSPRNLKARVRSSARKAFA